MAAGHLSYSVSSGNATITGYTNNDATADIVIVLNGVTSLGEVDFVL